MSKKKVIIVGAGIGGLSAAIRLNKMNYQVVVYDSASKPGGKTKRIEQDGFSWGYGASLLTLPHLIDELFVLCGKNPADYYKYLRLDPICKYFFSDCTTLNAYADREKLNEALQLKLGESPIELNKYWDKIHTIFKHTEHIFLQSSLQKIKTYLNMRTVRSILNLGQIGLFSTMNERNSSTFKHKNTIQLFNRYATYNGSNPYRTPATMNVIAAPEYNQGAFIMEDGMPQVASLLYKLAQDQGIEFVFNAVVQEIKVQNNQVQGVIVNNTLEQADIVVSNADVHYTYNYLLPNAKKPLRTLNQERSTSAMIFYWGMNRTFPEFETHNIFFSDDYRKEFDCIEKFSIYEDATAYLFISSKMIPKHAPDGMENWFVLINVPHSHNQDWDAEVIRCREILIKKISAVAKADISKNIVTERVNTPKTIERDTFSFAGSLYGPSSNNMMSAFLRHPNYSNEIKNLYFSGGSVHPGGGVPLCILSGKIVADLIKDTPS